MYSLVVNVLVSAKFVISVLGLYLNLKLCI